MEGNINKVIIGALIFIGICIPFLSIFAIKKFRNYIKAGYEGDNNKLELNELKEMINGVKTIYFEIIFFFLVFTTFAFNQQYDWWMTLYTFLGILGAETSEIVKIIKNFKK